MLPFALTLLSLALGASAADLIAMVPANYERVWWDRGGWADDDFICWGPQPTDSTNFKSLGHRGQKDHADIHEPIYAFKDNSPNKDAMKPATGATWIWDDRRSINWDDGSVWRPQCPEGYVAVGDFFYIRNRIDAPGQDFFHKNYCVKESLTAVCSVEASGKIWDDSGSLASNDVSIWQPTISNATVLLGGFLFSNNVHEAPPSMEARCLLKSAYTLQ